MIDEVPTQVVFIIALLALLSGVVGYAAWQQASIEDGIAQEVAWSLAGAIDRITRLGVPMNVTLVPGEDFPSEIAGDPYQILFTQTTVSIKGSIAGLVHRLHFWVPDDPGYSPLEVEAYDAANRTLTVGADAILMVQVHQQELDGKAWMMAVLSTRND